MRKISDYTSEVFIPICESHITKKYLLAKGITYNVSKAKEVLSTLPFKWLVVDYPKGSKHIRAYNEYDLINHYNKH